MSGSRSPSTGPNILTSSEPTTSRPDTHEETALHTIQRNTQQSTLQHTSSHSFRSWTSHPHSAEAADSQGRRRSTEVSPEQPQAKRMRRPPSEEGAERHTPSSSSQGDMADTEMDRSQQTTMMSPPSTTVPPKKKRTRTLTTPHQSAVLHALLAQSRFPSTAVREEVGRSIGLSARKVQIWFQNQRQKARRPRSQSGSSLTHPQQYPNVPTSSTAAGSYDAGRSDQGPSTVGSHPSFGNPSYDSQRRFEEHPPRGHFTSDHYHGSVESPPQLLGPGMPGSSHGTSRSFSGQDAAMRSLSSFESRLRPIVRARRSHSPESMQRPTTSRGSGLMQQQDVPRTLPRLVFDSPRTRGGPHTPFSHPAISPLRPSSLQQSPFIHQLSEPPDRHSMSIPPPFTLQPRWEHTFPTLSRLGTASWTARSPFASTGEGLSSHSHRVREHRSSDRDDPRDRLQPPLASDSARWEASTLRPEPSPPVRAGRYDPVRAAVIPYEGSTAPTTVPTSHSSHTTRESLTYPDDKPSYERRYHRSPSGSN